MPLKDRVATSLGSAPWRRLLKAVGLVGGGVGFSGFFVNYFASSTFSLSDTGSKWMDLIPVCFGVAGLALLVPRTKAILAMLASTTAGVGLGIAIGPRVLPTLFRGNVPLRFSYGAGFGMMFAGGVVLVAAWIVIGGVLTRPPKHTSAMTTPGSTSVMEETPVANSDAQALFEEARRLRRRRFCYVIGAAAFVAAAVTIGGLAAAGVLGAKSRGVAASSSRQACPTGSACIYVLNRTGIVPIGLRRYRIGPPLSRSAPYDLCGERLAITPNGRTAYVLDVNGLIPISLRTGAFGQPLPLRPPPGDQTVSWVLGPSGRVLYLEASRTQHDTHCSLEEFSLIPRKIERSITLPNNSRLEAIAPDGTTGYVATGEGADLVAVDLRSGSAGPPIAVSMGINNLAISANGDTAYATGTGNIGTSPGHSYSFITPVDLATGKALNPIRLDHAPTAIALAPNGRTAYVTGNGSEGPPARPAVMVVDLVTDRVTKSIRLPAGATAIAIASRR